MNRPSILAPDPSSPPVSAKAAVPGLWGSLFAVGGAWFVLAWPWLIDGLIIPWDAKNHFYPILRFVAQSLHDGQSPAWNPYHMGGYPLISDPQSMLFSPLMLALAALVEQPSMRLVDAVQLLHLLIGGVGVMLLCRSHRWIPAAGLFAAIVYMFGGSAAARLQHTGIILSYGWLPLAFWLLKETLDRADVRWAAGFGVAAAIVAANRDQVAYLGCLMLIGYVVHRIATAEDRRAFLASRWRAGLAAFTVGAVVIALPVLLTLQLLGLSNRPEIAYDQAITGSLAPINLLTLVMPNFFQSLGGFADYWGPGGVPWDAFDWTDRSVNYLYAGALPILLLLRFGLMRGWLGAREVRFYVIVLLAALVYALGRHTPVFGLLFGSVPGIDLYRRPADATFILGFVLAVCVGYTLHRLAAQPGEECLQVGRMARVWVGKVRPAVALLLVAIVAAIAIGVAHAHGHLEWALGQVGLAGLWLGAAGGVATVIARGGRWRSVALGAAVMFLVLDLRIHNAGASLNAHDPHTVATFEEPEGDRVAAVLHDYLERAEARDGPYRAEIVGLGGAWQNAPMVFDIEATLGYNPLRLAAYQTATGAGETSHTSNRRFSRLMGSYRSTLANLLGIRFICTTAPIETLDPSLKPGDMRLVEQIGRVRIYENAGALPRVMLVPRAVPADADAILVSGVMPPVDYATTVLIEDLPEDWMNPARLTQSIGRAVIAEYSNTEIRIEVDARTAGFLVLNDLWYPYWHAYVGDVEYPIHRANVLFRAVQVPAGRHTVVFRFEPFDFDSLIAGLTTDVSRLQ